MKIKKNKVMVEYITCDTCGYNNRKDRFEAFGKCLGCGKILDNKVYFKAQMLKRSIRKARIRGVRANQRNLPF